MRRYSPLIALFMLSGLLARTGLAGASGAGPTSEVVGDVVGEVVGEVAGEVSGTVAEGDPARSALAQLADLDLDGELGGASQPSWVERIDARLAGLEPVAARVEGPTQKRLRVGIEHALASVRAAGRVAVEVRDLDSGAVVFAHDAERPLNPASNQKLITAIAAVELLGPDYRFETTVWREGDALVIRGEGDPDLHVHDLHGLAAALVAQPEALAGIRRIVVDDSAFDLDTLGPGFRRDGPGDSYMAPSGALALDYGTVAVTFTPGSYRQPAAVHVEPAGAAIEVHGEAATGGRARVVATTQPGDAGQTIVEVGGTIPGGHAPIVIRRRVADPGLVAGACFAALVAELSGGLELPVSRGVLGPNARAAGPLARHTSEPLVAVLASALRYSNNFTAEQVLRTLAWRASGEPGSWAAGVAVLERFAAAASPSHAGDQRFVNGSGLSLEGRLSPAFIVDALALAARPGGASELLLASFASAGGEGTLHNRLAHAKQQVLAKTGTYAGASTLSGLVQDGERRLGFSILVNGAQLEHSRAAQDRVVAALLRAL